MRRATRRPFPVNGKCSAGSIERNRMATPLVPEVLVVDPLDGELEQLLAMCGMRTTRATAAELGALAQAGAQQPDVVVVDTRGVRAIPASMAVVKRQHPTIG